MLKQNYRKGELLYIKNEDRLPISLKNCQGKMGIFLFEERKAEKIGRYEVYVLGVGKRWFASFEIEPFAPSLHREAPTELDGTNDV